MSGADAFFADTADLERALRAPAIGSGGGAGRDPDAPSLVDVLDRLLDRGVVVVGDLRISVADVDLLFVGVKLFAASIDTMEDAKARGAELARARWDGVAAPPRRSDHVS